MEHPWLVFQIVLGENLVQQDAKRRLSALLTIGANTVFWICVAAVLTVVVSALTSAI